MIRFAVDFFRQRLRLASGMEPGGDADLCRAVSSAPVAVDLEQLAALLERSLEALGHVDRNAHQATLIECWLDDLARGRAFSAVAAAG